MTASERHLGLLRSFVTGDGDALHAAVSAAAPDLISFLQFAHRHQLGAFTYWMLQREGLADGLPEATLAAMRASSLVARRRTERQLIQLRDLAGLFDANDVEVLFMKGPLFAQRFYGSMQPRGFSDLDVLVPAPDVERVDSILASAGYDRAHRALVSRRVTRYFAHHFEYRRDDLPLDVHWALQRHFTFAIDYARIRQTAARVTFDGTTYSATSDEYELVLQILGVVTDLQVGQLTLRGLVDIFRVLKAVESTIDWDAFFAARRSERVLRPCRYVLASVLDLFDCHGQFPRLASQLEPSLSSLPSVAAARHAVLESRKVDVQQKLLAFRLYERSVAASFSWWLLSLPFRLAAYSGVRR
jgi:hypothetical protein